MDEEIPTGVGWRLYGQGIIEANSRFMDALNARPDRKIASDDPAIERAIWEAAEAVLREHAQSCRTHPFLPFPNQVSWLVADTLSQLLAGGEPDSFRTILHTGKRKGAPKRAMPELDYIRSAVAYIKAARQELIDDKHPVRAVCNAFGVGEPTVRGWCADKECKGMNPSLHTGSHPNLGQVLRAMMLEYGRVYSESRRTRSQDAVARRAAKRKS